MFEVLGSDGCRVLKERRIDIEPVRFYFSLRSPFAGIALHRVMHCAEFADVPFTLFPVWPDIIFGGHMDNPSDNLFKMVYIFQDAARQAEVAGLDNSYLKDLSQRFAVPQNVDYRRRKLGVEVSEERWEIPHAAMLYARAEGKEWDFAQALFARRFGFDGQAVADILQPETLASVAERVGLDGQQAVEAHASATIQNALTKIERSGERDGVFGVPFFVLQRSHGQETFWGNDHLEYLLRSLRGDRSLPVITAPVLGRSLPTR